jgi:putative SOS response-associated peptidase YedK
MLRPYRAEAMGAYPVSPLVNSPKNDDARCLEPAA